MKNLKLAAREQAQRTIIPVGEVAFGRDFVVMAGPCSVESEKQTLETAWAVKAAGADVLRGGAFKPRTSPYSFQGLGLQGLKILDKARRETGLPIVTEVLDLSELVPEVIHLFGVSLPKQARIRNELPPLPLAISRPFLGSPKR